MSSSGSKQKTKDKKSDQTIELENRVQSLIRENLELSITVRKQNEKIVQMKTVETVQQSMHKESATQVSAQMQKLELLNLAKDQHIKALRQKKEEYQIENGCLNYKLQRLKKQFDQYKAVSKQQYEQLSKQSETQIKKYQVTVNEYQMAINERLEYLSLNQKLQNQLQFTKDQQKRRIADKDRDKLQTIDFLKKEMHQKTKQLKTNLLSMRRDQMATNTRLTVLQNHQLLQELQYQSKHTEKILKRNQQLQKKTQSLSKQLELEKQINDQLAKRSTIAKKIIKNINDKNNTLQKQLQQIPSTSKDQTTKKTSQGQANTASQASKSYSNTIKLLESQITQYQQRLKKLQQQKTYFQQLYETNQPQYEYYLKTQNDLRLLMIKFISNAFQGKLIGQQNSVEYDISRLKDLHVDQWKPSDIEITIKMLLTFIKPYFNMKHMKTHYLKHNKWNHSPHDPIDHLIQNSKQTDIIPQNTSNTKLLKSKHMKMKSLSYAALNPTQHHSQKTSNNVSPAKQFSLHAVLQDQKNKSLSKSKKCRSQHNLSNNVDNKGNSDENKFSSGQQSSFKPYENVKQNCQHGFKLQQFKNKETKKLTRTNIRDWGKKVHMQSRTSLIMKAN